MKTSRLIRVATIAALALMAQGPALAQAATLAPGQVTGPEIQSWLDADGFAVGGVNLINGCWFIARTAGGERSQTIHCPTLTQPVTVVGSGTIVGHQFCSKFSYPDGSKIDRCHDLFKVGDNKYELRFEGRPMSVVYRLVR